MWTKGVGRGIMDLNLRGGKRMHILALIIWGMNIVLALYSYFYPTPIFFGCLVFFIWIIIGVGTAGWNEKTELNAPKWARWAARISTAYTIINFFVCVFLLREGGPGIQDGIYCIENHGDFIREINYEEYMHLMRVESRFFYGHLLVFTAGVMEKHLGIRNVKI